MSSSDLSHFIATDKHGCISVTVLVLNTDFLFSTNKQNANQSVFHKCFDQLVSFKWSK